MRLIFRISVVFLAVVFIIVIGPQLLELEGSQALAKKKKGGRFCTDSAKSAYNACLNEIKDDYNIAVGKCINVSDGEERSDCYRDAKAEYKEAKGGCKDQLEARRDICEDLGEARYDPDLDPADFSANITNTYFPLNEGKTFTYHSIDSSDGTTILQTVVVEVGGTTTIDGFPCRVVTDRVYEGDLSAPGDHNLLEDTTDWYSQDVPGNVWYFGESTIAYSYIDGNAIPDNEGTWVAGENEAKPGIIMPANPAGQIEMLYRQEFDLGTAEDFGRVIETGVAAPGTSYINCVHTEDSTPMEPDIIEDKYYAPNVGLVLTIEPEATEVLISGP